MSPAPATYSSEQALRMLWNWATNGGTTDPSTQPPSVLADLVAADQITIKPTIGALTNRSGSITAGGTRQELAPALATRTYFFFQNISAENLWIDFGTNAVADQPSIRVVPGGTFVMEGSFVSNQAIDILGATTGSKFVAKEG